MSEMMSKSAIRDAFEDWLEGYGNNSRFLASIDWETSFCISVKGPIRPSPDKEQTSLIKSPAKLKLNAKYGKICEEQDKDIRQGNLRRR